MIRPYEPTDFHLLENWVTDPDILFLFAGTEFSYPITQEQIINYQAKRPDRRFYLGFTEDNIPFAFGEIIPQEDNTQRVGRLLVGDPALRGKGLGSYFVKQLIAECIRLYNTPRVDLYVWENNQPAIRCYKSIGFNFVDVEPYVMMREGKQYNLLKMSIPTRK